ncbi:hypothetical protein NEOLI_001678 [Neolecta irregularis DAH-3]|uniref:Uncharacterized protein n=1 Tax=Neolecta irregularis (strain DAH-3) TaxID=1198029 RepID=A0A1U7LRH4_NEOID|nr:hypothetical protein NEOLI_001678 [Neolecta irregularis DAH-3]|eukprot:OLL25229.1 hypothetical protein NEOLI_001678 [Neolecta irregularis DAH-3]
MHVPCPCDISDFQLDIINWTNRIRNTWNLILGHSPAFNAVAFYLGVAGLISMLGNGLIIDMLAHKGY